MFLESILWDIDWQFFFLIFLTENTDAGTSHFLYFENL